MAQPVHLDGSATLSSTAIVTSFEGTTGRHQQDVRIEPSLLSSYHDKDKLDLAIVIDGTHGYLEKYFRVLYDHHKYIFRRLRQKTKLLRVSLVVYKDASTGQPHRHTGKQEKPTITNTFISDFVNSLEELSQLFKVFDKDVKEVFDHRAMTHKKNTGGLADALLKVSNLTFRRNANKICIILAPSFNRTVENSSEDNPSLFVSPDGHDAVKLSRFLASKGIVISILGCAPSGIRLVMNKVGPTGIEYKTIHVPQVAHVNPNVSSRGLCDCTDILEALSLITGGQYIPIFSTSSLTKLITCIIEEDLLVEDGVGYINDCIMLEVVQQFCDVNAYHLTRTLCAYFNDPQRKCSVFGHLLLNKNPVDSVCDFAERLSWASCLEEMKEIPKGPSHKPHLFLNIVNVQVTREGDISEKEGMRMVRRLIARMGHSV